METVKNILRKNPFVLIAGTIALVIIILLLFNGAGGSPTKTAEEFLELTQNEEWDKAGELLSSEKMAEYDSAVDPYRAMWLDMNNLSKFSYSPLFEYEMTSEVKTGDVALVTANLSFESGEHREAKFELVKEGGKWVINRYGR
jgi:hypothetical protein